MKPPVLQDRQLLKGDEIYVSDRIGVFRRSCLYPVRYITAAGAAPLSACNDSRDM